MVVSSLTTRVQSPAVFPSHSSVGAAGMVENTPSPHSPDPAPGAATDTKSFALEKGACRPNGSVAATLSPELQPPLTPPIAAAGYCSGLGTGLLTA